MLKWKNANKNTKMAAAPPDMMEDMSSASSGVSSSKSQSQRVDECPRNNSMSELHFQWGDFQILRDFDNNETLPCVAKIEEDMTSEARLVRGLKMYCNQPLLFNSRVRKRQARARTIYHDKSGAFLEVGQTLLIPEDYPGWFELVPPEFTRAACFRTIAEVADAMPRKFFTRSNLKAIRIEEGDKGESKFLERKVAAGSSLLTDSVFTAKWKTSAEIGLFRKKQTEWVTQEVKYLKCIDTDQKEILVPLSHKGKFNAVYEKGKLNQHSVYTMKDILSDLKLPVKVRLLYGKAPTVPCIFTGLLCIRHFEEDDVIVCSTVVYHRNVLLDIPVSAPCKVRQATRDEDFTSLSTFADAQKLCHKYARAYSSLIKLSPELDTGQQVVQHVPTNPDLVRQTEDTLRTLDLLTDISQFDDMQDMFMESDTDSLQSDDFSLNPSGTILELSRCTDRQSATVV